MTTKPNAFTMKPDLTKFIKENAFSENAKKKGRDVSGSTTPPFRPRTKPTQKQKDSV